MSQQEIHNMQTGLEGNLTQVAQAAETFMVSEFGSTGKTLVRRLGEEAAGDQKKYHVWILHAKSLLEQEARSSGPSSFDNVSASTRRQAQAEEDIVDFALRQCLDDNSEIDRILQESNSEARWRTITKQAHDFIAITRGTKGATWSYEQGHKVLKELEAAAADYEIDEADKYHGAYMVLFKELVENLAETFVREATLREEAAPAPLHRARTQ
jgi:hypothetical protein